jgi:hypothetical protein
MKSWKQLVSKECCRTAIINVVFLCALATICYIPGRIYNLYPLILVARISCPNTCFPPFTFICWYNSPYIWYDLHHIITKFKFLVFGENSMSIEWILASLSFHMFGWKVRIDVGYIRWNIVLLDGNKIWYLAGAGWISKKFWRILEKHSGRQYSDMALFGWSSCEIPGM